MSGMKFLLSKLKSLGAEEKQIFVLDNGIWTAADNRDENDEFIYKDTFDGGTYKLYCSFVQEYNYDEDGEELESGAKIYIDGIEIIKEGQDPVYYEQDNLYLKSL